VRAGGIWISWEFGLCNIAMVFCIDVYVRRGGKGGSEYVRFGAIYKGVIFSSDVLT